MTHKEDRIHTPKTATTHTFTVTEHNPRVFELLFGVCPWPKPDWWVNDEDDLHS